MALGALRRNLAFAPRQTKAVAYKTFVRPQLEYASPVWHPHVKTQIQQVEVQRTAVRWTFRRWRIRSSEGDMLVELEWPSLETRRKQSSLPFIYKIHIDIVSLNTNRYLTPVTGSTQTRASKLNSTQYRSNQAYNDALKNSFFPWTIPQHSRMVLPLLW